jgi:hypothetical protein
MKSATAVGIVGIYTASIIVGMRFVKTHRRLYTDAEWKQLRNRCLVYLLAFDTFVTFSVPDVTSKLSGGALCAVIAFSFLVNLFVLWMAQKVVVRKQMQKQLDGLAAAPHNKSLERSRER